MKRRRVGELSKAGRWAIALSVNGKTLLRTRNAKWVTEQEAKKAPDLILAFTDWDTAQNHKERVEDRLARECLLIDWVKQVEEKPAKEKRRARK